MWVGVSVSDVGGNDGRRRYVDHFLSTCPRDGAMAVIDRLVRWAQRAQELPLRHLPPDEHVIINERQHPAVLLLKAIRTGSGLGMMISSPTLGLVLIFGGSILADTIRDPSHFKRRTVLLMTVG